MAQDPWAEFRTGTTPTAAPPIASPPATIPGMPKPAKPADLPSGWEYGPDGMARPIKGLPPKAVSGMGDEPKDDTPSGYRKKGDGNLEFIPGGPADPNKPGKDGNSIPNTVALQTNSEMSQFLALQRAASGFKDNFGGNWLGGLENTAQAYSPVPVGTPGQSEWWADFKTNDNMIRNELFGATLTPSEQRAYDATTVQPGMNPEKIRDNLSRRLEIVRNALERKREFQLANGYRKEAVDALFAPLSQQAQDKTTDESGAPPRRFLGNTRDFGDDMPQTQLTQSDTDRRDNPVLSGVRSEYMKRLERGDSAQELIKWAREAGIHPSAYRSIGEQVRYRRANPDVPLSEYDTSQLDDEFVPLSAGQQTLNQFAQSPVGAGLIAAGDAASAFNLDSLIGATGGNAERARLGMEQVSRENPVSSLIGTIAGGTAAALTGEAALGMRGLAAGIPRAMAADTAYGAAAGAGATDDGSSRLLGAAQGALVGAGASFAGNRAGNALARFARGTTDPAVQTLQREGITDLTVGQAYGGSGRAGAMVRAAEDRLSGIPVVGDMINARRTEGLRQFNAKAFDKALEPIGKTIAAETSEEAFDKAQKEVSQAFTDALAGKGAVPDPTFDRDLSQSLFGVKNIKRVGDEIFDEVVDILKAYDNDPMLSGEALQEISRQLRDLKFAYKQDPLFKRVGSQVDRVERAVFDLFDRQASGTVPEYNKARQAYRRLSILEDAALRSQNQQDGMFTAAQLRRADKANAKKFSGKAAATRGDTPFNDLTKAGQEVLPNKVPDSGTAGRLLLPLALVGGGAGADQTGATNGYGLTIGGILAALYTKTGQRALTKGARGAPALKKVMGPTTQRAIQAGSASTAVAATNQQ